MASYPTDEQLVEMTRRLTQAQIEFWRQETVFSWPWWLLAAMLILPWFAWYGLADKRRLVSLGIFLLVFMVLAITLDEAITSLSLRFYPHKLVPLLTRLTSTDYSVAPIMFTLAYQWFTSWRSFFRAAAVAAALISFVGEPVFKWLGFYVLIKWQYYYGFPVLLGMGLAAKWLTDRITAAAQAAKERGG